MKIFASLARVGEHPANVGDPARAEDHATYEEL